MNITFPTDVDGNTAMRTEAFFHYITARNPAHEPELLRLIDSGICLEAHDEDNKHPLYHASENGFTDTAKALLAAGADPNTRNRSNTTYLQIAADSDRTEIVNALLAAGAQVEARDEFGWTALHHAVWNNSITSAIALFAKGANIYASNWDRGDSLQASNFRTLPRIKTAIARYERFRERHSPPKSASMIYELLSAYPLKDPQAPVDRDKHLRQIFHHAKWESAAQAGDVIAELQKDGLRPEFAESLQTIAENTIQLPAVSSGRAV